MSQRIFQVLVPLCLLAVLACGSPRIYPSDQQTRGRRHDCASCRRERPEALASWYAPPGRREYPGLEPEIPRWHSNRPFQPYTSFHPSPYNFHGGAPRGRGGPGIASPRGIAHSPGTYRREDPFNFQRRGLGFDVVAAPAAPVREDPFNFQQRGLGFDVAAAPAASVREDPFNFQQSGVGLDVAAAPAAPVREDPFNFQQSGLGFDVAAAPAASVREDPFNFQQRGLGLDVAAAPAAPVREDPFNFQQKGVGFDVAAAPAASVREDPFNFQQRGVGIDLAAAPAALLRGVGAPSTLYQPRFPVTRSLGRTPYQSSSFYDVIKRESGPEANNRYTGFDPSEDEAPIEDVLGSPRPYEDPKKKVPVVYRADKYADDSLDQGNSNAPAEESFRRQAPEHHFRRQAPEQYSTRQAPGQYFRRQAPEGRTPADRQAEEVERFQQPTKEEYLDSHVVHAPEIKRDPYHWVPERNIMKIMQNAGKEGLTVTNGSAWQDQKGQELEGSPRKAAKIDGQKQAGDVNVLNDGDQSDEGKDGSQELGNAAEGYGNVERSKKSTMLTPSTEISDREPANMWKTTEPRLEISTEPLTLP